MCACDNQPNLLPHPGPATTGSTVVFMLYVMIDSLKNVTLQQHFCLTTHSLSIYDWRRNKQLVEEAQEWEQKRLCEHGKLCGELEVLTKEREEVLNRLVVCL